MNKMASWGTEMKKIILSFLIIIVFIIPTNKALADTFAGNGAQETSTNTFTVAKYAKITWSLNTDVPGNNFHVDIYRSSDDFNIGLFDDYLIGNDKTTYLYNSGTFYFDVYTEKSSGTWTINTQETNGEYLSPNASITGTGSKNTELFHSEGNTNISWSTTRTTGTNHGYTYQFDLLNVETGEYEKSIFNSTASPTENAPSGFFQLTKKGDFYFDVFTAGIDNWTFNLNGTNPNTTQPTTQSQSEIVSTTSSTTSTTTSTTTAKSFDIVILFSSFIMVTVIRKKRIK